MMGLSFALYGHSYLEACILPLEEIGDGFSSGQFLLYQHLVLLALFFHFSQERLTELICFVMGIKN